MPGINQIKSLWKNWTRRNEVEADLSDEIASYQSMIEEEYLARGVPPTEAKRRAAIETEGAEQVKLSVRDARAGSWLEGIGAELRHARRGLLRRPGFAITAAGILAIGLGATITVFSVFYAALLQSMPYKQTDRLFHVKESRLARGINQSSVSMANFWDVAEQTQSFSSIGALRDGRENLTGTGAPVKVSVGRVTPHLFETLGVQPMMGRGFREDDVAGTGPATVAVLGAELWKTKFGSDPNVLGSTIRLNDRAYTVLGILPNDRILLRHDLFLPFGKPPNANRGSWEFEVIARLKDGVSVEAAKADLARLAKVLDATYPEEDKGIGFVMFPSSRWLAGDSTRQALWVLLFAVGTLMLITCFNVANLLLARGLVRHREIAIRSALGAGRERLARFVVLEALLLSLIGAVAGLGIAAVSLAGIRSLSIPSLPRLVEASINPWVVLFAVGLAIVSALIAGITPALRIPRLSLSTALREGERQTGSRGDGRARTALVVVEVALSFVLLAGSGLLIQSFLHLTNTDPGFDTENRLLFYVGLPNSYFESAKGKMFIDEFRERLEANPRVIAAAAVNERPVEGGNPGMSIDTVSGASGANPPWAGWRFITPGYFKAIGLTVRAGRAFTAQDPSLFQDDDGKEAPVRRVILSYALAQRLFPDSDAIGKPVMLWKGQSNLPAEVVGVVENNYERGLAAGPGLTVYFPYAANVIPGQFVVHTKSEPLALVPDVRSLINSIDPNLPISDIRALADIVDQSVAPQRLNARLLGLFSIVSLILAATGIYGVLSFSISRRTSEIGLRLALGASAREILTMAIAQGLRPALIGIVVGGAASWWLSRYLETLLVGVERFDAVTYVLVIGVMLASALLASYAPGMRAMKTDPMIALRAD